MNEIHPRLEPIDLERKMNLQEETEVTENEMIVQILSLTQKVNELDSYLRHKPLNLRCLCFLL